MKSSNNSQETELIAIGKVIRTHGIHGRLRVRYYNENKSFFLSYGRVLLMTPGGHPKPFGVTEARIHRRQVIVKLENVESIDQAERLVGAPILVEKAALPVLEEGEYYWTDLIGMDVWTERKDRVGKLADIIPTGGTDVFVIKKGEKEILVPANDEVIRKVDIVARHMTVCLPEEMTKDDSI
ncbi:MAG: 16S rRNA processing protein RimM [Proteobacteria bacterium]|nr:16S rRNA processing protein RimM [Pseudomonadota bacterium]